MTIEELDNIPAIIEGKAEDEMETAARMMILADAYWKHYEGHDGSEGASRGQNLSQRCYEIIYENLGRWSWSTQWSLMKLCHWNISKTERTKIVDRVIALIGQLNEITDVHFVEDVILCCFRNDDYNDGVKALIQLYGGLKKGPYQGPWLRLLFSLHLEREEWDEAEALVARYPALTTYISKRTEANVCAYQGEMQIKRGQLADGEATLQKGVEAKWNQYDFEGHFSCCGHLLHLYLQQERWKDAEIVGLDLIKAKEFQMSNGYWPFSWDDAATKANRVITINRWRTLESWAGQNTQVYFLQELYSTKRQVAVAYAKLERYDEAQQLLEELTENKMHEENPILLASKELLVDLYIKLGKLDDAEKRQEEIIAAKSKSFGYDSDKIIPDLEKLVDIYQKNNHLGKRHHVKLRLLRYR
ncbi:hypothetical protein CPB83DRAFT_909795 [Crepidotus variabilis]|uniref:Uncharacterized protein n=1 Tax=Crepidotus variabilis TaxID=179855 RepID=A0A9P6E8U6_9AGAR|nr:hypothetical protein CPB83DRAFT_909795 [Crepidotus variabilis]